MDCSLKYRLNLKRSHPVRLVIAQVALCLASIIPSHAAAQAQCYAYEAPWTGTNYSTPQAACNNGGAANNSSPNNGGGTTTNTYVLGFLYQGSQSTYNAMWLCNDISTVTMTQVNCNANPGLCGTQSTFQGYTVETSVYPPPASCGYFVEATTALPEACSANCPADPVNPGVGNVIESEDDVSIKNISGSLLFKRYYNSADANGSDMGPGWRHSYGRSIEVQYEAVQALAYPGQSSTVSPEYTTPAEACVSGFAAIQAQVNGWQNASAAYTNNVCVISTGAGVIGTLPILSPYVVPWVTEVVEYDVIRDDGQTLRFTTQNGGITPPPGVSLRLAQTQNGLTLTDDDDNVETYSASGVLLSIKNRAGVVQTVNYDSNGLLQSVTDSFGNALAITRNVANQIATVAINTGAAVQFAYDANLRLSTVTNLDGTTRNYTYGNPDFPVALTALTDENALQFATWGYDSQGRANATQEAGGAGSSSFTYNPNGTVTWQDALGAMRTFSYTRIGDINRVIGISGSQCPTCQESAATTYDNYGWVASRTDYNGNLTCYSNDPVRGLQLVRVEGFSPGSTCPANLASYTPQSGTRQRKITTTWNPNYREPSLITQLNRTTSFVYYSGSPNVHTITTTDTSVTPNVTRKWTYTYNSYGQVLTAKGPRTDVNSTTTYQYNTCSTGYQCGQLETVTDPVGNVTTFLTYNAYGEPLTLTDPNGVETTLTYDGRERLTSREVSTETTGFSYYPTGLLDQVTLPDSSYLVYTYDGAHRLTQINDGLGNKVVYTLDALGNHTADNAYDPTGVLHHTNTRVFNTLSELYQDVNAADTSAVTTTYGYDGNGNQTSIAAPLSRNTAKAYDELNRLKQIIDPASGNTYFGYDANDDLTSVEDPNTFTTGYTYNGFGDLNTVASPDTGATTDTYDSGGNLSTSTDARSAVSTYKYDAANRPTSVSYKIGSTTDQIITFTYDAGTYGKGRLTGASDANESLSWTYDPLGRVVGKGQTVGTVTMSVGYGYTNSDLVTLTTPSGQTVVYGYNTNHQVVSVSVNGTTVLNDATYEPLGPANGWAWGNGVSVARTYNTDGLISQISATGVKTLSYDNAMRIEGITDTSTGAHNWTYGYDLLDRITSGAGGSTTRGWTYDANGNRLTETGSAPSTYTISPTNNTISSITGALSRTYSYDAAGHVLAYSSVTATYNNRGRVKTLNNGTKTETLTYNALGQMVKTSGGAEGTVLYMYDEAGHLLGEYSSTGTLVQETVWLGDTPVATLRPSGSSVAVYYVEADHLNTPRQVTRPSDSKQMWTWFSDPFGTTAANSNPAGAGTFIYNLRFPGQIYDNQAGLQQNVFRDYDPAIGRYVESDPLGLKAGVNTYNYASQNPISRKDPQGQLDVVTAIIPAVGIGIGLACYINGLHKCEKLYPNHKDAESPDYPAFVQCSTSVAGVIARGIGITSDPVGGSAAAAGEAVGHATCSSCGNQ